MIGAKITYDGEAYYCISFRTRMENLKYAWMKLWIDCGGYVPTCKEEFLKHGGSVEFYRSY